MEIRRIVPIVREQRRFGRAAADEMGETDGPVAEIRERYDGSFAYTHHFAENADGPLHFLQRLAEDDEIECCSPG